MAYAKIKWNVILDALDTTVWRGFPDLLAEVGELISPADAAEVFSAYTVRCRIQQQHRLENLSLDEKIHRGRQMILLRVLSGMISNKRVERCGGLREDSQWRKIADPTIKPAVVGLPPDYRQIRKWVRTTARANSRHRVSLAAALDGLAPLVPEEAAAAYCRDHPQHRDMANTPYFLQVALGREMIVRRRLLDLPKHHRGFRLEDRKGVRYIYVEKEL